MDSRLHFSRLQLNRLNLVLFVLLLFSCDAVHGQTTGTNYPAKFTVAKDGSGDFKTIQEAVNAVRDLSVQQVQIFIKPGVYAEKLVIPSWKTKISLIGTDKNTTIITHDDYSGKSLPKAPDAFGKDKFSTYTSYTLLISGNDCRLENLTIRNTSGRVGQAVALHVEGDRISVNNCNLLGNQDTLYAATENSRQYYSNCLIEGTTDFIFGSAIAVFENCIIHSLQDSYITAASTAEHQKFGLVFLDCKLTADSTVHKVYLGRPWRPFAKTAFIRTDLGRHIRPEGWDNWRNQENEKTAFYAEYQSRGPGADQSKRVSWARVLSKKELKAYTPLHILAGSDHWNPIVNTSTL